MGLFGSKSSAINEKHFLNVIKNEAPGELLLWRHPLEDFNLGSVLVVAENEQALFVRDGLVEQVFDGGRYELETDNYPFISALRNKLSGDVSSFHCVVYFVRLADSHEIYWGTDTPIQLRDPVLSIPVTVQARGAYRIRIVDAKKFFLKMAGNNEFLFTQEEVTRFCQSQFSGKIKSSIGKELRHSNEEILGVCERQDEFAELISPFLDDVFNDYGFHLVNFSIAALDVPMDDPYRQKVEMANADRIAIMQTGQAENFVEANKIDQITGAKGRAFETLGGNWGRQQAADILQSVAENPGTGDITGLGAGFGFGMAAGGSFGSMAQDLFSNPDSSSTNNPFADSAVTESTKQRMTADDTVVCPNCGLTVQRKRYCSECGNELPITSHCAKCGNELSITAKFCPECGTSRS